MIEAEEYILPYSTMWSCPKCGSPRFRVRYSDALRHLRMPNGCLEDVRSLEDQPRPHLVISCGQCGWAWLSETADGEEN